jgi:hypothetical protein
MVETFIRLLEDLPDWAVYREVAAALAESSELVAWRRLCESHPGRYILLREAVRALALEMRRRSGTAVSPPANDANWAPSSALSDAIGTSESIATELRCRRRWS